MHTTRPYKTHTGIQVVLGAVITAASSTAFAENTDRSKAEPVCMRPDVLLCENWEDGDSVRWDEFPLDGTGRLGGVSCLSGRCEYPYGGYQSDKTLAAFMQANTPDTLFPSARFDTQAGLDDTLYVRYYTQWSKGYEFNLHENKNGFLVPDDDSWRVAFQLRPGVDGAGSDIQQAFPFIHFYCGQLEIAPGSWQDSYCSVQEEISAISRTNLDMRTSVYRAAAGIRSNSWLNRTLRATVSVVISALGSMVH